MLVNSPLGLLDLVGKEFLIGEERFRIEPRGTKKAHACLAGGEGYVFQVRKLAGGQAELFALKLLASPTPERRLRVRLLSELGLWRLAPTFAATRCRPLYGEVTVTIRRPATRQERLIVDGYLAPFVPGDTFADVLAQRRLDLDAATRIRLATELCTAIAMLESVGLVHTDIGPHNVMLTNIPESGPALRLIDFDGVYHARLPLIPLDGDGGRKFGMDGYRHHSYQSMDESVVIRSDRLAMAALAFELVVLHQHDLNTLGRESLLSQDDLDEVRPNLPQSITSRWEEGWELVKRAIVAADAADSPSPGEWLAALRRHILSEKQFSILAPLVLQVRDVQTNRSFDIALHEQSGTLADLDPELTLSAYKREEDGAITLRGKSSTALFLATQGKESRIPAGEFSVSMRPGVTLVTARFDIGLAA